MMKLLIVFLAMVLVATATWNHTLNHEQQQRQDTYASICRPKETGKTPPVIFSFRYDENHPFFVSVPTAHSRVDFNMYHTMAVNEQIIGTYYVIFSLMKQMEERFQKKGVMVDLGGNFGFTTLASAIQGHQVITFEASPYTAETFRSNIQLNCVDHLVTLVNEAVGDREGSVQITTRPSNGHLGAVSLKMGGETTVPLTTVDSKVSLTERPYLMKLDIELSEDIALMGSTNFLANTPPYYIIAEIGSREVHDGVIRILRKNGYSVYVLGLQDADVTAVCDHHCWMNFEKRPVIGYSRVYDLIAVHETTHSQF